MRNNDFTIEYHSTDYPVFLFSFFDFNSNYFSFPVVQ